MRMWMVNPKIMCKNHLLGEHREMHALVGMFLRKKTITGYIKNNLLTPVLIKERHDQLVTELLIRGYNHNTPLQFNLNLLDYLPQNEKEAKVDNKHSLICLLVRCNDCYKRFYERNYNDEKT